MSTLTLSGWGQPHDALASVVPDAQHADYARHDNVAEALEYIAELGKNAQRVIGWSLGGQLAVRAIAAGMLRPEKLILIGVPFQFVVSEEKKLGMKRDLYEKFRDNYAKNPARTLHKAWELVIKDDAKAEAIRPIFAANDPDRVMQRQWLTWLNLLDGYSCEELHLADFPETLIVHGDKDAVVGAEQMQAFAQAIPHARTTLWNDCGHAPHWHDTDKLKELIADV